MTLTAPDHEIDLSGTAHGQFEVARRILHADELCRMKDLQPQFEKEMKLPGDSRGPTNTVFMFSVNGLLDGKPVRGALFAGEAMLVQARTLKQAERIAREGLRDTARFAVMELEQRPVIERVQNAGLAIEAAGQRGSVRASEDEALLRTDQVMKKILATEIGKLPWRH